MENLWLKIRVGVLAALGLVVVIIFWLNRDATVEPGLHLLFKQYEHPPLLMVLILDSVFSIFGWWFFWTIFGYLRQLRGSRERNRLAKVERELAEQKAKAAMLKTRPGTREEEV